MLESSVSDTGEGTASAILLPRTPEELGHGNCKTSVKYRGDPARIISQASRKNKETDGSGFKKRSRPVMGDAQHTVSAQ